MTNDEKIADSRHKIADSGVRAFQKYRHYKGHLYKVVAVGLKEDTLDPMVVYKPAGDNDVVWIRTLDDFLSLVQKEVDQWPDDECPRVMVRRFQREYD